MGIQSIGVQNSAQICRKNSVNFKGFTSYVTPDGIASVVSHKAKNFYVEKEMISNFLGSLSKIEKAYKNSPLVDVFAFQNGNKVICNVMPSKANVSSDEVAKIAVNADADGASLLLKVNEFASKLMKKSA